MQVQVRGLYPKAALLPHDCVPNTFISLDENKVMKIYASVAINAGGIIFNNYTDSLNVIHKMQLHFAHFIILISGNQSAPRAFTKWEIFPLHM